MCKLRSVFSTTAVVTEHSDQGEGFGQSHCIKKPLKAGIIAVGTKAYNLARAQTA